jgi:predicted transcriptional regulator
METEKHGGSAQGTIEQISLAETIKRMEETCKNCNPLSTLTCIADCNIWKLKNELRGLHKKMQSPDFTRQLLNVLKNKRRLKILEVLSKGRISITKLQQELRRLNHYHSQKTIVEEYVDPLLEAGLAAQDQDKYSATVFGNKLNDLTKGFQEIVDVLPSHSECYEETVLETLLRGQRTHEALEGIIPPRNVARVLSRLLTVGLIRTPKENDYVFLFKTQRNPNKETLSPTEKKTYGNIPEDGISTRRLATEMSISLRRTYKYLRKLKGKKLIFVRQKPKTYALTERGAEVALMLQSIQNLVKEISETARQVLEERATKEPAMMSACEPKYEKVQAVSSKITGSPKKDQTNS